MSIHLDDQALKTAAADMMALPHILILKVEDAK